MDGWMVKKSKKNYFKNILKTLFLNIHTH